ncbi:uncharacterized protein METZ01_LOCUS465674 [marine metagenome]|uniref:Uncharacterized protein n=1 Tax=marine metagenome TaxID=408172 RepID=A0A383AZ47_9ZZZZ
MVGAERFELSTSSSRTMRANQAALRPDGAVRLSEKFSNCNVNFQ